MTSALLADTSTQRLSCSSCNVASSKIIYLCTQLEWYSLCSKLVRHPGSSHNLFYFSLRHCFWHSQLCHHCPTISFSSRRPAPDPQNPLIFSCISNLFTSCLNANIQQSHSAIFVLCPIFSLPLIEPSPPRSSNRFIIIMNNYSVFPWVLHIPVSSSTLRLLTSSIIPLALFFASLMHSAGCMYS